MSLVQSSIGRKIIMGICGLVWTGFVLGHMAGNMLIWYSAEAFNKYGHAIVSNKPLLYTAEVVLLLSIIGHVVIGIWLTIENRKAAPQKYAVAATPQKRARFGSKTMAYQGTIILFFIIYHLITFKYGAYYTVTYDGVEMRDLARLMVEVFQQPGYVVGYIVCLILLGIHLSHGASSVLQTLGLGNPRYKNFVQTAAWFYAIVVAAGFISQPLYVFFGT